MKGLKTLASKRPTKQEREKRILMGLVSYYLETGKPVGSNSLKEAEFSDLSSATIRNYFSQLEQEGYLTQQHASGGRIPTHKAFRFYAHEQAEAPHISGGNEDQFKGERTQETREIASLLQQAAEKLSALANAAVFLSAPRFDNDYITDIKLLPLDHLRCLCVIMTDFGSVQTETVYVDNKLSAFSAKRIEEYFRYRLSNGLEPKHLDDEEQKTAQKIYKELMLRFVVSYSNFTDTEIHRTGFSRLLSYPEYHDVKELASSMSLFENTHTMRLLLKECSKLNTLKFWIGDDLLSYTSTTIDCAVIAIPYRVNHNAVGAVGILGPARLPYEKLFNLLYDFSENISEALTRNLFKFKIKYRQPNNSQSYLKVEEHPLLGWSQLLLIEDKRD